MQAPIIEHPQSCPSAPGATAAAEPPWPAEGRRGGAERHGYAWLRQARRRQPWPTCSSGRPAAVAGGAARPWKANLQGETGELNHH